MAEKGVHITQNIQIKPSIFEVVAAESLNSTFYPAIKRVANFLATHNPEKFSFLIKYYDELYLLLNGLTQGYYLKTKNGSLSEVFYGLSRYSIRTNTFDNKHRVISFITITILPYLITKLEDKIKKWKDELLENQIPQNSKKAIFMKNYVYFKAIYELMKLVQYILYMTNITHSHSIVLRAITTSLNYAPGDNPEDDWKWSDIISGNMKLGTLLSNTLFRGLELSAFFLQFLQWWHNDANQGNVYNCTAIPPVPEPDVNSERYNKMCPICLQTWQIPTVISISGYVYCYKCIIKHFEKEKCCPVTNYPANIEDLIRIYEE